MLDHDFSKLPGLCHVLKGVGYIFHLKLAFDNRTQVVP